MDKKLQTGRFSIFVLFLTFYLYAERRLIARCLIYLIA